MENIYTKRAKNLLLGDRSLIADAREGVLVGNSAAGSLLAIQYKLPRAVAEEHVKEAMEIMKEKSL